MGWCVPHPSTPHQNAHACVPTLAPVADYWVVIEYYQMLERPLKALRIGRGSHLGSAPLTPLSPRTYGEAESQLSGIAFEKYVSTLPIGGGPRTMSASPKPR